MSGRASLLVKQGKHFANAALPRVVSQVVEHAGTASVHSASTTCAIKAGLAHPLKKSKPQSLQPEHQVAKPSDGPLSSVAPCQCAGKLEPLPEARLPVNLGNLALPFVGIFMPGEGPCNLGHLGNLAPILPLAPLRERTDNLGNLELAK